MKIQNEKLHADMLTYRDQRNKFASEAFDAKHDLQQAHKAIYRLIKNIEAVRWLAEHDMEALRGLGCLPVAAIPDDESDEAWESIIAFRKAITK